MMGQVNLFYPKLGSLLLGTGRGSVPFCSQNRNFLGKEKTSIVESLWNTWWGHDPSADVKDWRSAQFQNRIQNEPQTEQSFAIGRNQVLTSDHVLYSEERLLLLRIKEFSHYEKVSAKKSWILFTVTDRIGRFQQEGTSSCY